MRSIYTLLTFLLAALLPAVLFAQKPVAEKPRILITTDIGGTDPDDNQSMMHYLLYSNEFDCEGLVSSPSYGLGDKSEILRMIDLYEQDLPKLKQHSSEAKTPGAFYPSPEYLHSKWSINAYVYIIENFPDVWMIENNSTYRSFIAKYKNPDQWNGGFYDHYVKGKRQDTDYKTGGTWWSDRTDPALYHDGHQGEATIFRHRKDIMEDWGKRCSWLE